MKIITECIIDMKTLEAVSEESYEYSGPVAECKGGGGGGGSSSGKVGYPTYMETAHSDWLDNTGVDTMSSSIVDIMDAALGNSPWTGSLAYDPDTELTALLAAPDVLQTLVTLLSSGTTLDTLIAGVLDTTRITTSVTAFEADLDARLLADILPRFEAGMRDINAVTSSAFAIGRAVIEENQDRQVAKYSADLNMKAFSDDAIRVIQLKLEYQKAVSQMIAEANRIKVVAKTEENMSNIKLDEEDALWDLEVFQYGANIMAAPGGAVLNPNTKIPSTAQSALGGAMTGAAAGAIMAGASQGAIAGPWGAAAGAALGAASAFL